MRPPADAASAAPGARWNVDPSGRHEYRFWDGNAWAAQVADSGTFSTDPFPRDRNWHPETLLGVAAGVVTVILVVGAIAGIAMELPGRTESTTVAQTAPATSTTEAAAASTAVPPAPPTEPATPPEPAIRPVAVIGTPCRANSTAGLTADGSPSYCERLDGSDAHLWSLYPGDIPSPIGGLDPAAQGDPAIAVCMAQTERSASECVDYLKRPSDPGDGPPSA